jgi:hypothetical protein
MTRMSLLYFLVIVLEYSIQRVLIKKFVAGI